MVDYTANVGTGAAQGAASVNPAATDMTSSAISGAKGALDTGAYIFTSRSGLPVNINGQTPQGAFGGMPTDPNPIQTLQTFTQIGLDEPWLSPDELRAKTNALQGMSNTGSSGGSSSPSGGNPAAATGGGATGGASGGTSGGINTSNGSGLGLGNSSIPNLNNQLPYTSSNTYQSPQGSFSFNTPQQAGNYAQGGALGMQQTNPQAVMGNYLNTPGNQLLGDPSYQRFQHSPGYQYAVDEAMGQVQRGASARGLLESGSVLRDMTDRAQGMAQQDYGNWWNRQNQLYSDYQNRLAGLAGGTTGAEQAFGLGQSLGQGSSQTGNNLASLFGNQGTAGFGGIVNTGAAQANNMLNAGNTQAQVNSTNQSTLLAGSVLNQNSGKF